MKKVRPQKKTFRASTCAVIARYTLFARSSYPEKITDRTKNTQKILVHSLCCAFVYRRSHAVWWLVTKRYLVKVAFADTKRTQKPFVCTPFSGLIRQHEIDWLKQGLQKVTILQCKTNLSCFSVFFGHSLIPEFVSYRVILLGSVLASLVYGYLVSRDCVNEELYQRCKQLEFLEFPIRMMSIRIKNPDQDNFGQSG